MILLVIWLLGLFLIGIIVGTPSLLYRDLEAFVEISVLCVIGWSIIWWGSVFVATMTGVLYL